MSVPHVLQVTDTYRTWDDAYAALRAQARQHGYLDGRVYRRDGKWWLQAIHGAEGLTLGAWLPDRMRVVLGIGLHWSEGRHWAVGR